MKIIDSIILSLFVMASVSCSVDGSCSSEEVNRTSSPDKLVDAVVIKNNCGATTSFSYRIFVVPVGEDTKKNSIFLADKVEGLNIQWTSSKKLLITYADARIFEYTNFWQSKKIQNFDYIVSISENKQK